MQKLTNTFLTIFSLFIVSATAAADTFSLRSKDILHGDFMKKTQEFQGFGCSDGNLFPQLSWSNAPEGTEAYAVITYDPDAPTGSGWWHWQLVNISKNVTSLPTGAGDANKSLAPKGSTQISNDYGIAGFGGACPPEGHSAHRYQFTVHALSKKLELPENASAALTGYMINAHSLGSSTIEALFKR